jgi:hypothetical protein
MIQKYFKEFTLTPALVQQIKQWDLIDTIARNLGQEGSYSLTPICMDLLNRLEESFKSSSEAQKIDAENALEELASLNLKINELDGLEFSMDQGVFQGIVKNKGIRMVVPKSYMNESNLEQSVLEEAPELFWMIHPDSPLMNEEARRLVLQIQYFNYLIKLVA